MVIIIPQIRPLWYFCFFICYNLSMKEALFYKKIKDQTVQCYACAHRCVIGLNKRGICGVRENQKGKLYSLVYGKAISEAVDSIEKKPFFHFLPGSRSLSIATVGCNFHCKYCQNWEIALLPKEREIIGNNLSPEKIIEDAKRQKCQSISYTYTEPTVFVEYALDTMELAKKEGLKNNWVTNGYMTKDVLEALAPFLDAANVDLKAFSDNFYQEICGARFEPVLDTLKLMKKLKIWVEITTLVIPTLNDREEEFKSIADFIKKELGAEVPWHISRFYPAYKLTNISPTPIETLHKAYKIGKGAGLKYVYIGNVPGDIGENTFCPKCNEIALERIGFYVKHFYTKDGKCRKCGEDLDLILK